MLTFIWDRSAKIFQTFRITPFTYVQRDVIQTEIRKMKWPVGPIRFERKPVRGLKRLITGEKLLAYFHAFGDLEIF